MPLNARVLVADERADALRGCVAVVRGSVVYCAEGVDQAPALADLEGLAVAPGTLRETDAVYGGLPVLEIDGSAPTFGGAGELALYRTWGAPAPSRAESVVRLVPYGYWGNRAASPMRVWMAEV